MKVLVISDTHKNLLYARLAIKHLIKEDSLKMVIHCGDHIEDAQELEKEFPQLIFHYVVGNCDGWYFKESDRIKLVQVQDKKLLITHGDCHNIKINYKNLFKEMKNKNADIGLCGHTHMLHVEQEKESGRIAINPGSISFPRDSVYPSYAVLDIEKDRPIQIKTMVMVDNKPTQKLI